MRRVVWSCLAVIVAVAVTALAWPLLRDRGDDAGAAARFVADTSAAGPGSLIAATELLAASTTLDGRRMHGARVTYRSSDRDGTQTVVTGAVFVPVGPAPARGWPAIAFAHPTTGIDEACAPSRSDSLRGMMRFVGGLVARGYAVAVTDYAGLGSPGVHRYTDHRTAGHDVVDSVRALRHTYSQVSDRWAAFGASQGGAAAWSADEQAGAYAPELDLVGAVAVVPAADMAGLVDKAVAGTLTTDQHYSLASIVETLARLHPELRRDDHRRGAVATYWDVFTACRGDVEAQRPRAEAAVRPGDLGPATPQAADRLRGYLREWAVPQKPLTAPLFVIYAGRDASIDMQWTRDAIARACTAGDDVQWQFQPEADHDTVGYDAGLAWLADRFAGEPAGDDCPR